MGPAEALASAMRDVDEQAVDQFDVAAAENIIRRLDLLGWRLALSIANIAARIPDCHPDRNHHALGLCGSCYQRRLKRRSRSDG